MTAKLLIIIPKICTHHPYFTITQASNANIFDDMKKEEEEKKIYLPHLASVQ